MRAMVTVAALVNIAGVSAAACSAGGSIEPPVCTNPIEATSVVMDDFSYRPSCPEFAVAIVTLDNQGAAPHTFTLEGTQVDVDIEAGERGSADLTGVMPGEYTVTCTYHPQMLAVAQIRP